jgi:putrescine aminotransferase
MSKSFGGGKSSISAYCARTPIFRKAYDNLNDATLHSTTYNGFGEECVTALEAINILVEDGYVDRARSIGAQLENGLNRLKAKYPDLIDEVRGTGALWGIILKADLNPAARLALRMVPSEFFADERFMAKLFTASVISELFNNHNTLTFYGSNREIPLILSPSLIASDEQIEQMLAALDQTLSQGKLKLLMSFARYKFLSK